MQTNIPVVKTIDPSNNWEWDQAIRDGYKLVEIYYIEEVEKIMCSETHPVEQMWVTTSPNYQPPYNNYNQQHKTITKEVPTVVRRPRALLRLSAAAEIIYGKDQ